MERHKCKLCLRNFANGRALGGHMRSHLLNRSGSFEIQQEETGSASPTLSSDEERDSLCYGLRENPKRSVKLADPEFSFVEPVPVQDRESEAESSKNQVRRRSDRFRKPERPVNKEPDSKRVKPGWVVKPECSGQETEPVSSVSDTTTEEDVAFCLMMMKRDKWTSEKPLEEESEDDDVAEAEEGYLSDESLRVIRKVKNKYKCETCDKVFKSYQALGGHRASHKRTKTVSVNPVLVSKKDNEEKTHECPVCYRVFSSGQALGGHKRSHVMGSSVSSVVVAVPKQGARVGEKAMIDLNLPAPVEDDDDEDEFCSQIELSALSEADFVVNSIRH